MSRRLPVDPQTVLQNVLQPQVFLVKLTQTN